MNIKCNHPSSLPKKLFQQNKKSHTKFNLKNKIKFRHKSAKPNSNDNDNWNWFM